MEKYLKVIIILLFFYRLFTIQFSTSDENVYLVMARQVMNGFSPYKDFFFAHPPLFLLLSPFVNNIVSARLTLFVLQALLIYVMDLILKTKHVNKKSRIYILLIFITTGIFQYIFNLYLGFAEVNLWLMISYYFTIKNQHNKAILCLTLACLTRVFALFYLPAILISLYMKEKKIHWKYLIALAPLVSLCFLNTNFLNDVFLYHLQNKIIILDNLRFGQVLGFVSNYIVLIIFCFFNPDFSSLMITLFMGTGVFIQRTIFSMYWSMIVPWLCLAGLIDKPLKYLRLCFIIGLFLSFIYLNTQANQTTISGAELSYLYNLTTSYGVGITGDLDYSNLASFITYSPMVKSLKEPAGIIDTSWSRIVWDSAYYIEALNQTTHLFFCLDPEGYSSICDYINKTSYIQVGKINEVIIYKSL